ncbi:MAG: hypothetical protein K9K86_07400 [Pseudomonadales bacterium]|nr:hypothetical protein [Pseudomonadales bacterium]
MANRIMYGLKSLLCMLGIMGCPLLLAESSPSSVDWVPVYLEPQHKRVFENDFTEVLDVTLPPGYVSQYHQHQLNLVYITISGSHVWAQPLGGERREVNVNTGDLRFSADNHPLPHIHRVGNIGDSPFRVIGVAIKSSQNEDHANHNKLALEGDLDAFELAIENEQASVYRIKLQAGESTGEHRHNNPMMLVYTDNGRVGDMSKEGEKVVAGQFQWQPSAITHDLKNMGEMPIEIIEVQWR